MDFSKAFNSVSYNILLNKMSSIWMEKKHNTAREQSADGTDSKGFSKWGYIRLMVSHAWGSLGLYFRANSLKYFYK